MSKKYKLLKDLPNVVAGEIGDYYINEYKFKDKIGGWAFIKKPVVENNSDWFERIEEVKEPERIEISRLAAHDTLKGNNWDSFWYQFCSSKSLVNSSNSDIIKAIEHCLAPTTKASHTPKEKVSPLSNPYETFGVVNRIEEENKPPIKKEPLPDINDIACLSVNDILKMDLNRNNKDTVLAWKDKIFEVAKSKIQ